MHIGMLGKQDHEEKVKELVMAFAHNRQQACDREMIQYELPWGLPQWRLWGLFDGEQLVGIMDGLVSYTMIYPFMVGMVRWFYVEEPYRGHSWKLMREGLRYAKRLGIKKIVITAREDRELFWIRHGFHREFVQLERELHV